MCELSELDHGFAEVESPSGESESVGCIGDIHHVKLAASQLTQCDRSCRLAKFSGGLVMHDELGHC